MKDIGFDDAVNNNRHNFVILNSFDHAVTVIRVAHPRIELMEQSWCRLKCDAGITIFDLVSKVD